MINSKMIFYDREDAGKLLAQELENLQLTNPVVIAIPRGGVPLGFEVAAKYKVPLIPLVVRKLGAPAQKELGIGAITENNIQVLDLSMIKRLGISPAQIRAIKKIEKRELTRRIDLYRKGEPLPDIVGKSVIIVDDGLATGLTMLAAIKAVKKNGAARVIVAVPVSSKESKRDIISQVDDFICLSTPDDFSAVGQWYEHFDQVDDEQVLEYIKKSPKL